MTEGLRVDQFVPTLLPGDAVGNHTLETQRCLRSAGIEGGIWSLAIHPLCERLGNPFGEYPAVPPPDRGQRVLLYQAATASGGIVDFLLRRPEPKSICHHNLTPPEFFDGWDDRAASSLRAGALDLGRLAQRVRTALADSEFNAADLRSLGVGDVRVVPPFLGPAPAAEPDHSLVSRLRAEPGMRLLFVSRVAPNKGHRHLLPIIAALRRDVDPAARLFLVGPPGPPAYVNAIRRAAEKVCPGGVVLTGPVSETHLAAYYAAADVFLCMSEHEGFGIPLVEAMRLGVPIVALDSGAVSETLGGAGVLLRRPDALAAAEVIGRLMAGPALRDALRARQHERALELEAFPRERILVEALRDAAG